MLVLLYFFFFKVFRNVCCIAEAVGAKLLIATRSTCNLSMFTFQLNLDFLKEIMVKFIETLFGKIALYIPGIEFGKPSKGICELRFLFEFLFAIILSCNSAIFGDFLWVLRNLWIINYRRTLRDFAWENFWKYFQQNVWISNWRSSLECLENLSVQLHTLLL